MVQRNFTGVPDVAAADSQALLEASSSNGSLAAPVLAQLQSDATRAAAFFPVSGPQFCTLKDSAAVKCSMSFTSSDLTEAYVSGKPLYLAFEATTLTQASRAAGAGAGTCCLCHASLKAAAATTVATANGTSAPAMLGWYSRVPIVSSTVPTTSADCVPS